MSYIRPSEHSPTITADTVQLLARLAGFTVPPDDLEALAVALGNQLASIQSLDEMDLTDVNPALEFDPRWRD